MHESIPNTVKLKGLGLVRVDGRRQINFGQEVEVDVAGLYARISELIGGSTTEKARPPMEIPIKGGFPRFLISCYPSQGRIYVDLDGDYYKGCGTSFELPTDPATFLAMANAGGLHEATPLFYQALAPQELG